MSTERMFPIMIDGRERPGSPSQIPWRLLEPMRGYALKNHSQSLERLAERGGLSACEALAILEGRDWRKDDDAGAKLLALVKADTHAMLVAEVDRLRTDLDAARATPTGGAGENAGARREET